MIKQQYSFTPDPIIHLSAPPERLTVGRHSGPGLRLIFWVQGCSLLCTRHCLNPQLLKRGGGYPVSSSALAATLLRLARDYQEVEGVTVLGGEPFDQAEALVAALTPARTANLSIMIYTGHTLESLQAAGDASAARLLELCDLLVDGPFIDEYYDEHLIWRGSHNQRILRLSERYGPAALEQTIAQQGRALSLSVSASGDLFISGAQDAQVARQLVALTRSREQSSAKP